MVLSLLWIISAGVLEKLLRRVWFFWEARGGRPYGSMQYAFRGHIVVLINEETGAPLAASRMTSPHRNGFVMVVDAIAASDGEAFAEGARRLGLATIMGTRTWGGEIWLSAGDFTLQAGGVASGGQSGVCEFHSHSLPFLRLCCAGNSLADLMLGRLGVVDDTEGKEWLIEGPGMSPDAGFEVDNLPVETYHGADRQIVAAVVRETPNPTCHVPMFQKLWRDDLGQLQPNALRPAKSLIPSLYIPSVFAFHILALVLRSLFVCLSLYVYRPCLSVYIIILLCTRLCWPGPISQ